MKHIIKKIGSVLAGISLIGATILGATAQSYPEPFVKDGNFNGLIVVGSTAASQDVIGSIDVGASLQYAMKREASIIGNQDATIDNGYKIAKSGDSFNYGDTISDVLGGTSLTEEDLPQILSDGRYVDSEGDNKNSITYTQDLTFQPDNAELLFTQDDDTAPTASDYLVIRENEPLYTYSLEFDSSVKYNNADSNEARDDFKTTTLTIQGKTYTISDVTLDTDDGKIDKLSLISGEAVVWLTQNQPIKKMVGGIEHEIEVLDVTDNQDACQIKVDGQQSILDIDETRTISGVQIGVTDVRAIHAQLQDTDTCQLALGASEIVFENDGSVKVDEVELDGTEVDIDDDGGYLNSIKVTYTPEDIDDDLYLKEKQAFTDPIFTSWKIVYGGLSGTYGEYSVKTSGDEDAIFKFTTNDNKKVEIPMYMNAAHSVILGDGEDPDEKYYYGNATCTGISSVNECEGMKIIATPQNNGEVHIFEITNIDANDNTTDIKDLTYGRTYDNLNYVQHPHLDLGSFGGFDMYVNSTSKLVNVSNTMLSQPEIGSDNQKLTIDTTSNVTFKVSEGDAGTNILNINVKPDTDNDITVIADWLNSGYTTSDLSEDSDYTVRVTTAGTKVTSKDDKSSVVVESPNGDDEVYGNVFVAPIKSSVYVQDSSQTYTINKIEVGSSKLDTEISDITAKDMIVFGGPCVNSIAAKVLGSPYKESGCANGFTQNTAMIKAVAQANGKVAIIVAGYGAYDTQRAPRVLANFDDYNLTLSPGSAYSITGSGSDLSNIIVTKSS